ANATISDKRYLWAGGNQPTEERDSSGTTVLKRYFPQGEQIPAAAAPLNKLFYTKDHLGNIRELTDSNGTLRTRYDYDMLGKRVKLFGTLDTEVGYTGHHHHEKSVLVLTWFRAYDAEIGRWLSADPLGNAGGLNLYAYSYNDPINLWDPDGLAPEFPDPKPGESVGDYVERVAPTPEGFLDKIAHYSTHDAAIANWKICQGAKGDVHHSVQKGKAVGADIASLAAPFAMIGGRKVTLTYHPRIRERGVQDPRYHNAPYSFDKEVLKAAPIKQKDGSLLYCKRGTATSKSGKTTEGTYEIGVNPETGVIFHRQFKPDK
ncbi:MAG: RHS repeat domain-containing protein, partial [Akkermansiaceae bacterium]